MQKIAESLIFIIFILGLIPLCFAATEDITEINGLVENAFELDGKQVTVQGEAIGEVLERGEYSWININDTTNAIGIWAKQSDINQIQHYGDYKHKGDIVRITGEFHRACPEHGGDVDIHLSLIHI